MEQWTKEQNSNYFGTSWSYVPGSPRRFYSLMLCKPLQMLCSAEAREGSATEQRTTFVIMIGLWQRFILKRPERNWFSLCINALRACLYIYIRQLSSFRAPNVVVYRSYCRYLLYSVHFSEFMPIFFTRKRKKKQENTRPPFFYDTKMAAEGY